MQGMPQSADAGYLLLNESDQSAPAKQCIGIYDIYAPKQSQRHTASRPAHTVEGIPSWIGRVFCKFEWVPGKFKGVPTRIPMGGVLSLEKGTNLLSGCPDPR